jgi:hypothetical protein
MISAEKKSRSLKLFQSFFLVIAAIFIQITVQNQELDHAVVLILLLHALMIWFFRIILLEKAASTIWF